MVDAIRWSVIPAIVIAPLALALGAGFGSLTGLPSKVRQEVKDLNYWCSRFGGVPPKTPRFVRTIELTGDRKPDYLVDLGRYDCRKHASFMSSGHDGFPVRIFVGGPKHTVRLGYDGNSYGVELMSRRGRLRVWLKTGALACGQPPGTARSFADWWLCSRPLEWDGRAKKFSFGPLSEVRQITIGAPSDAMNVVSFLP